MNALYFDIYDYRIEIKSSSHALKNLKVNADFSFFSTEKNFNNHLQIKIAEFTPFEKRGLFIGKTRMCEVRQTGVCERQLIYSSHGRTLAVVYDKSCGWQRQIHMQVQAPEAIDDILYFIINSCAGEYLDAHGIMRVHAFSYMTEEATLVYGASGTGKSTLALAVLSSTTALLYSDEISLYDLNRRCLLPYPLRISVAESAGEASEALKFNIYFDKKNLIPIPAARIAPASLLTETFILSPMAAGQYSLNTWGRVQFVFNLLAGAGLIQMWEYLLRLNNFSVLIKILGNRARLASHLLKKPVTVIGSQGRTKPMAHLPVFRKS